VATLEKAIDEFKRQGGYGQTDDAEAAPKARDEGTPEPGAEAQAPAEAESKAEPEPDDAAGDADADARPDAEEKAS
jgi:hypothetical protein